MLSTCPPLHSTLWCHKFPPPLGTSWSLSSRKLLCYSIILDYGNIVGDRSPALPIRCITATAAAAELQRGRWHEPWLPQSSLSASDVKVERRSLRRVHSLSSTALCGSAWPCRTFSLLSPLSLKFWGGKLLTALSTVWGRMLVFFFTDPLWKRQTTNYISHIYCTFSRPPLQLCCLSGVFSWSH